MPIDPQTAQRVRDEAERRGIDPELAIAEAEKLLGSRGGSSSQPDGESKPAPSGSDAETSGEPLQLLIGHLSFVRVRELRDRLGFPPDFPDQDLPCGVWQRKHETGGAAAAPAEEPAP